MSYKPLPVPPPLDGNQTVVQRGLAILAFIIEHRCTVTIDDRDLEFADHAGVVAVSRYGMDVRTYDTISDARHMVTRALKRRTDGAYVDADTRVQVESKPRGNPSSPVPLAPLPKSNPPAGMYADEEFAIVDRVQF